GGREGALGAGALERLRGRVLAGLAQEKTDPDRLAGRAFERAVYPPGHPLRSETLEQAQEAVTATTREDVERFYRQQYGPDRMILVIAGDVKADRVRQSLEARLGSWPPTPRPWPTPTWASRPQTNPNQTPTRAPANTQPPTS